jgi:hypothetical protein
MSRQETVQMIDQMISATRGTVENYYDERREHESVVARYRRGDAANAELLRSMRRLEETRAVVAERNPGRQF